jgi:hypothetical protein
MPSPLARSGRGDEGLGLQVVAAGRTCIDDTWSRPVVVVAGLRHTALLAGWRSVWACYW